MENVFIRKAELKDMIDIQQLNKILFEIEYKNHDDSLNTNWTFSNEGKDYIKDAIDNDIVLVATINEKIVAYLIGSLNTEYSYNKFSQAELDNMCVLEEYRNLGIGRKLFEKFKQICIKNNIKELKVVASYKNKNAIEFYKRNGFEEADITLKQRLGGNGDVETGT